MPSPRPNSTTPDPALAADFSACLRDSAHLSALVGLMAARGIELVPVRGTSANGTEWGGLIVTGAHNAEALMRLAAVAAAQMDDDRRRARMIAERG